VTRLSNIVRHIESLTARPLDPDEGVHHGDPDVQVASATVSWMATPDAIEAAAADGSQVLICHESLYYPYDVVIAPHPPPGWREWTVNRQRSDLLRRHGLTCLRIHGAADTLCIIDAFADRLGLGAPAGADGLCKVYDMAPRPLGELVRDVKRRTGLAAVRVSGADDLERVVRRPGLLTGGLGLFVNVGSQVRLQALGCDVCIAGESDNYGFRYGVECGLPLIETSHELSENPGLRRFTALLAAAFPAVTFRFHELPCVWRAL